MEKEYIIIDDKFLPEQIELYKDIDYVNFNKSTEEVTMTVGQLTALIVYAVKHYSVNRGGDKMQCISLKEVVAVKQYSEQLMQIIEHCESIQEDDGVSDYHKERAKVHAYEDIVALVKVSSQ